LIAKTALYAKEQRGTHRYSLSSEHRRLNACKTKANNAGNLVEAGGNIDPVGAVEDAASAVGLELVC